MSKIRNGNTFFRNRLAMSEKQKQNLKPKSCWKHKHIHQKQKVQSETKKHRGQNGNISVVKINRFANSILVLMGILIPHLWVESPTG